MEELLTNIRNCRWCESVLPHDPKPVLQFHPEARILIIGQAPGQKAHASGIPWNDASGKRLRTWMGIDSSIFYDPRRVAIMPMGFCYPGQGSSGDLPPRPECAPKWHTLLLPRLAKIELTLLIGQYAQQYYLGTYKNLTETVRHTETYLPDYWPLPHPSPRNQFWLRRNQWFEQDIIPALQHRIAQIIT